MSILTDVQTALWNEDTIRFLDYKNISVVVDNGKVTLSGHVVKNKRYIEGIVHQVPGVTQVQDDLVADQDLAIEVAQALAQDPRTRPYHILVGCRHGWVHLNGQVPDPETQTAVEEVAAHVPAARGVVTLPRVVNMPDGEERRPLRRFRGTGGAAETRSSSRLRRLSW